MASPTSLDRQEVSALFDRALTGRPAPDADRALVQEGAVKTFALEVNAGPDGPGELLQRISGHAELGVRETDDPTLYVLTGHDVTFFADILNPRFWLVHTTSAADAARKVRRRWLWDRHEVDACWLPVGMLRDLGRDSRWFKADFRGTDLLPADGVRDRRLRMQLEGEQAEELLERIQSDRTYRTAAALSAVGNRLVDPAFGVMDEIVNHDGYFVGRGDSFDLHVSYVARVVEQYEGLVRSVEDHHRLTWSGHPDTGYVLGGEVFVIRLGRPIVDLHRFVDGLFSARDPFRLWAIPTVESNDFATAEVVDLHIGEHFMMDIAPDQLRLYLGDHVCGNTALRILANLQHRYDATATPVPSAPAAV